MFAANTNRCFFYSFSPSESCHSIEKFHKLPLPSYQLNWGKSVANNRLLIDVCLFMVDHNYQILTACYHAITIITCWCFFLAGLRFIKDLLTHTYLLIHLLIYNPLTDTFSLLFLLGFLLLSFSRCHTVCWSYATHFASSVCNLHTRWHSAES